MQVLFPIAVYLPFVHLMQSNWPVAATHPNGHGVHIAEDGVALVPAGQTSQLVFPAFGT